MRCKPKAYEIHSTIAENFPIIAKAVLRGKFIAMNAHIKNRKI
jgi:hypothetical protein